MVEAIHIPWGKKKCTIYYNCKLTKDEERTFNRILILVVKCRQRGRDGVSTWSKQTSLSLKPKTEWKIPKEWCSLARMCAASELSTMTTQVWNMPALWVQSMSANWQYMCCTTWTYEHVSIVELRSTAWPSADRVSTWSELVGWGEKGSMQCFWGWLLSKRWL